MTLVCRPLLMWSSFVLKGNCLWKNDQYTMHDSGLMALDYLLGKKSPFRQSFCNSSNIVQKYLAYLDVLEPSHSVGIKSGRGKAFKHSESNGPLYSKRSYTLVKIVQKLFWENFISRRLVALFYLDTGWQLSRLISCTSLSKLTCYQ